MLAKSRLFACLVALVFPGCATRERPGAYVARGPANKSVYFVNNGWHTGIAVRKTDVPPSWPAKDFGTADFLEVGWGNNRFYRAQKTNAAMALRAAFPSESAIQVVGIKGSPKSFFRDSEVLGVRISAEGLQRLCQFVGDTFQRDARGDCIYLGLGVSGPSSRFYGAVGQYHLTNTCNVWTARAMEAAGVPVRPAMTADGLARQVRKLAVQSEREAGLSVAR